MAKRQARAHNELVDGLDVPQAFIAAETADPVATFMVEEAIAHHDVVTGSIVSRLDELEAGIARLREELAQHEADRRTDLEAEVDKHITQWARGRITQEHVRRTLLALIDKL